MELRNNRGDIVFRIVDGRCYDKGGRWVYNKNGDYICNADGHWLYRISDNKVYDTQGKWVLEVAHSHAPPSAPLTPPVPTPMPPTPTPPAPPTPMPPTPTPTAPPIPSPKSWRTPVIVAAVIVAIFAVGVGAFILGGRTGREAGTEGNDNRQTEVAPGQDVYPTETPGAEPDQDVYPNAMPESGADQDVYPHVIPEPEAMDVTYENLPGVWTFVDATSADPNISQEDMLEFVEYFRTYGFTLLFFHEDNTAHLTPMRSSGMSFVDERKLWALANYDLFPYIFEYSDWVEAQDFTWTEEGELYSHAHEETIGFYFQGSRIAIDISYEMDTELPFLIIYERLPSETHTGYDHTAIIGRWEWEASYMPHFHPHESMYWGEHDMRFIYDFFPDNTGRFFAVADGAEVEGSTFEWEVRNSVLTFEGGRDRQLVYHISGDMLAFFEYATEGGIDFLRRIGDAGGVMPGRFEGTYYLVSPEGSYTRYITFRDDRFYYYVSYAAIAGFYDESPADFDFDTYGFFDSYTFINGSFVIDNARQTITLHFDNAESGRRALERVLFHPFMTNVFAMYPDMDAESMIEYEADYFWGWEEVKSFIDGPAVLYSADFTGGIDFFNDVLIREGFESDILYTFGGDERFDAHIIGRWNFPQDPRINFTFYASGAMSFTNVLIGQDPRTFHGTWRMLNGNRFHIDLENYDHARTGEYLFRIHGDTLTLSQQTAPDGWTRLRWLTLRRS